MQEHEQPWNPLRVDEVSLLFIRGEFPWWIAGGIALELAVGGVIRKHSDIDVLILRRDHLAVREALRDWDCWVADPPGNLRIWPDGEELGNAVHDIWCRKSPKDDWRVQLMLDEADEDEWVSRRNDRIRAPIDDITRTTSDGVRYIAPHILLFYKAKSPQEKDEVDFDAVINSGISIDKNWLRYAIACCYGESHPWLERLA